MTVMKRECLATLLTLVPIVASAHGDRFEDYSCYNLQDYKIHYCVPYEASLVTMEVTEDQIWAHYISETRPVTYSVSIENVQNLEVPQDIATGYALTQIGSDAAIVNPVPHARAITLINDLAIVEVEARDEALNAFFVEVFTPTHIARFSVIDDSPEFPDKTVSWNKIRSNMRYLIDIERYPLMELSPIKAMETAPWP